MTSVIESFAEPAEVEVTRFAAGSYVSGRFVDGAETTLSITAAILPLELEEIQNLAEGKEVKAAIKIYSETELKTGSETEGRQADLVSYDGRSFEVQKVDYRGQIAELAHYKAIAFLKD